MTSDPRWFTSAPHGFTTWARSAQVVQLGSFRHPSQVATFAGENFRMNEFTGAVLGAQLTKLDTDGRPDLRTRTPEAIYAGDRGVGRHPVAAAARPAGRHRLRRLLRGAGIKVDAGPLDRGLRRAACPGVDPHRFGPAAARGIGDPEAHPASRLAELSIRRTERPSSMGPGVVRRRSGSSIGLSRFGSARSSRTAWTSTLVDLIRKVLG